MIVGQPTVGLVAFRPFYVIGHLMRLYPATGQAVVMSGNLTRYPVERLAGTILAAGSAVH